MPAKRGAALCQPSSCTSITRQKKEKNMSLPKLDLASFEQKIYGNKETCLVVFSRKNCHTCGQVVPMLEDLAASYTNKAFNFYYVDVEEQNPLYRRFSLKGVPCVLFFSKGNYEGKMAGIMEEEAIIDKISSLV
jgi:thioredoxin 1